jgi:hypothetical protein
MAQPWWIGMLHCGIGVKKVEIFVAWPSLGGWVHYTGNVETLPHEELI